MRKKTTSFAIVVALLIVALSLANTFSSKAKASTNVNSMIIKSDTTWTIAQSPYTLFGNILVDSGVTLTIEAGTAINLNSFYIMVNGTLVAKGNSANQIGFQSGEIVFAESSTDWNEQSRSGSMIANAFFNHTSLSTKNAAPKIINSSINQGDIIIESGSPVFSNNHFHPGRITINSGSPIISNNDFLGARPIGSEMLFLTTVTINDGSPSISKNNIHYADIGIEIKQGNPYISDNNITACSTGILANTGTLERNYVENLVRIGNVTVRNNTIGIEVISSSSPTIMYNNLSYLRLSSSSNVDAANNWWGTTNTTEIDRRIWDYNDDFNLGKVNYTPFLTEQNPQAMPDPNASLPDQNNNSNIPEADFYSTAIIAIIVIIVTTLLAVGAAFVLRKKKQNP